MKKKSMSIGMDIQTVSNFPHYDTKTRQNFYCRIFTDKEIAYCASKADPRMHFAARYAVKNAIRTIEDMEDLNMKEIEILNKRDGRPVVHIRSRLNHAIRVSLSHTKDHAASIVLWSGNNKSRTFLRDIKPRRKNCYNVHSSPQQATRYSGKVRDKTAVDYAL